MTATITPFYLFVYSAALMIAGLVMFPVIEHYSTRPPWLVVLVGVVIIGTVLGALQLLLFNWST